ncbi:MAG: PEGA domain-containing protein [Deltaproteobacteria bacterium]|nr:PEGA domain-containing protein [Deltaproteobacteria bacterium]
MLGRLLEAKDTLLKVTRYPQQPDEPAAFAAARAEAGALADKLATRIPSIRISLATPAGPLPEGVAARVEIDGVELPAATIKHPRKVDPGTHAIAVSAPGYDPVERKIEVKESTEREIEIVLRPPPAPPAPAPKATAPPQAEPPGGTSPLVWIGFGVGGAGLVAGAITGALSLGKVSDLEEACNGTECPPNRQADIDSMNLLANISNVGFGVGAAGVVVGVVGLFLSPSGQSGNGRQSALGLRPAVGPGSIGVSGTF